MGTEFYNELIRAQLQNSASDLSPTATGLIYFNTTSSIAKIYTGSSWKTFLFADLSNITGTLAIANGGTGQTSATAAFDALAPTTTSGDTIYHNGTDNVRLPIGSNGQVLGVSSNLPAWIDAPSGSGGINYIDNNDFESSVTGWTTYADAAGSTPVDGTGGTPNVTFTRNTTTPLSGNADGKFSKDAANRQGQGVAAAAVVPRAYQYGQKSQISFAWDGTHANYVAGDMVVYVYDVTNSTLITPTATALPKAKTVVSVAWDQSSTGASYRLIFHVATTNASAYDIYIDDIQFGPGQPLQGAVVSEWQSYSLTIGAVTTAPTFGTITANHARYRRIGDSMQVEFSFSQSSAGTSGTGNYYFSLPSGYTIDSTKILIDANGTTATPAGTAWVNRAGGPLDAAGYVFPITTTQLGVVVDGSSDPMSSTVAPFTAAMQVKFNAIIPIAEWAGSGTFAGQNNVEYAFSAATDTTAGAVNSSSSNFRYGPSGAQFNSIASTTANSSTIYHVGFQSPIQSTDRIELEFTTDGGLTWFTEADIISTPVQFGNTSLYGMQLGTVNSTTVNVQFGNKGRNAYSAAAVGDNGATWASIAGSATYKWRVKKVSGGQTVGFGHVQQNQSGLVQRAGQLLGTNTNDSAVSGYVGEIITATSTSSVAQASPVLGTIYDPGISVDLSAGDWMIYAHGVTGADWSSGAGSTGQVSLYVRTVSTVIQSGSAGYVGDDAAGLNVSRYIANSVSFVANVKIAATTTYKLSYSVQSITGSPVFSSLRLRGDQATTYITAVRIR